MYGYSGDDTGGRCGSINGVYVRGRSVNMQVELRDPRAILPTKAGPQEVGYDLVCIEQEKTFPGNVIMYDTGIAIQPPEGYYTEIHPRSSIVKRGVMLANSTGIIDPTYRGTIKICLKGPPLACPFSVCQMILRRMIPCAITTGPLTQTTRGCNGFGSTKTV